MSSKTYIAREEVILAVGLNAAIFFERLKFIIEQNTREGKHFKDGKHWTQNTYEGWRAYFPFFSTKQIRGAIDKLVEAEMVIVGRFNKQVTDRTNWYTIAEQAQDVVRHDLPSGANGNAPEGKSRAALEGKSTSAQKGKSYKDLENPYKTIREHDSDFPISEAKDDHDLFDDHFKAFCAAYPRLGEMDQTRDALRDAVVGGVSAQTIISAAKAYAEEQEGNPIRFVKYSENWLAEKRWEAFASKSDQASKSAKALIDRSVADIKAGRDYAVRQLTPAFCRSLVVNGLVSEDELAKVGLQV